MRDRAGLVTDRPAVPVAIVLTAAFLVMADSSIVNVAIPVLRTDIGATFGEAQLVVAAYQITYAALLIVGGRLGDRFGRRRLFLLGLAGFVVASIGCGLAPAPTVLIALRAVQGAAAAMMFPQTLSVIQVVVPRAGRPVALAVFGTTGSVATIAGPLVSGLLIRADLFGTSWRPAFLVNLPIGLAGLLLARRFLPESRSAGTATVDVPGGLLGVVALGSLVVALVEGRDLGWPWWTVALAVLAVPALAGFHLRCRAVHARGGTALIPPPLWRDRAFVSGLLVYVLSYLCLLSFFLYLAVTLQYGFARSPLGSALIACPYGIGTITGFQVSTRLRRVAGGRTRVFAGSLTWLAGTVGLAVTLACRGAELSGPVLLPALAVSGLGVGIMMAPLLGVILGGVRHSDAGAASGILSTGQQVGSVLGIALVGAAFTATMPDGPTGPAYGTALYAAVLVIAAVLAVSTALIRLLPRG